MSTKGTKKKKSNILKIGQSLTIDITPEILSQFQIALDNNTPIKIKSDIIESIDLTGIQLLYSMLQENQNNGIVELDLLFSDSTKELIKKCGFTQLV